MKHEARAMLAQGSGMIINNASMGGIIGFGNASLYIAGKHAVVELTKTAAIKLFKQGIRVNAICPGLIDTPFQDRIRPSELAKKEFRAASVPARMGPDRSVPGLDKTA
jgi:NAD(P)-dependent dehydrogenase (short-subunit alcohol dehydrogenase family)